MLNPINKLLISIISAIPESLVYIIAKQYVAGTSQDEAIKVVKSLNDKGYLATLDILGEHTKDKDDAKSITNQYVQIYNSIYDLNLMCNISVKPTHIGADIDDLTLNNNLDRLLKVAEKTGISLTETRAMYPAASVCGWYFSHPNSRYFSVSKSDKK